MKKLLFVFLLLFTFAAKSQDSTYVQLELKNGKFIKGLLIQKSDAEVTVATPDLGKVTLAWSTIRSMNMISKDGNDRTPNPHSTRYFFAPSAIPLKKGEKYYQNALFLVNSFQVGLNDHFSIGGGLVIPFALFITPKIGYQVSEKVHVGGGILFATSLIRGLNFGIGTAYGSVTYGTKEHNLTLNGGLGAYNENTGFGRDDYNWKFAKNPLFTFKSVRSRSRFVRLKISINSSDGLAVWSSPVPSAIISLMMMSPADGVGALAKEILVALMIFPLQSEIPFRTRV